MINLYEEAESIKTVRNNEIYESFKEDEVVEGLIGELLILAGFVIVIAFGE